MIFIRIAEGTKGYKFMQLSNNTEYKNLDCGTLELLLVQVDKENSIEFSFNCYILLIHILYLLLFIKSCASLLNHSLSYVH